MSKNPESGFARVFSAQPALPNAHEVSVECDIAKGLHAFTIVGLPDKAVEESKDRIAAAIKNTSSTFESPKRSNKKIVFSLAPADLKKEGAVFDLALAIVFLLASQQITFDATEMMFVGELTLDGTVRPIRGALSVAMLARTRGYRQLFLPEENCAEAALVADLEIIPVRTLADMIAHLGGATLIPAHIRQPMQAATETHDVSLGEIRGQESAKRALEIAAAGRHNIAFFGPPGTGKTMLARVAVALLPDLTESEMIEVTTIHSYAGHTTQPVTRPPFRAPHHTSSYASLIGGGTVPRPGEVTLAHRGVLFLDEFPEFHRDVINALREPLEDARVSVARARGSATFPANFMLVAALNPCPCGKYGSAQCTCMPSVIEKYRRKISGPVADRIDMWVHVGSMPPETLAAKRVTRDHTREVRERIRTARTVQQQRFSQRETVSTNADMRPRDIESLARMSDAAEQTVMQAARTMNLSARGYHRTIKLARTIADLAGSETIEPAHMLEALQYRERTL